MDSNVCKTAKYRSLARFGPRLSPVPSLQSNGVTAYCLAYRCANLHKEFDKVYAMILPIGR
jgi:hypothetical protein